MALKGMYKARLTDLIMYNSHGNSIKYISIMRVLHTYDMLIGTWFYVNYPINHYNILVDLVR